MNPGFKSVVKWVRETWSEADYAHHRLTELQLGTLPRGTALQCSELERLEATYALPAREPGHGLE
jgi:hypothetical protein